MGGAAAVIGSILERARRALWAGCDMLLVCNDYDAAKNLVDGLKNEVLTPQSLARIEQFRQQAQQATLMTVSEYEVSLENLKLWGVL